MQDPASAVWFAIWCGVAFAIAAILLSRPGGDYTPTRWSLWRAWLAAWFRSASKDRLVGVLMTNNEDDQDSDEEPETTELPPVSATKRNDETPETGIAEPKQSETDRFSETACMAVAKLINAGVFREGYTETDAIEAAFGVTAGGSKNYKAARDGVHRALAILRTPPSPPERFRPLDEQSKPAVMTRQPPRKKLALEK